MSYLVLQLRNDTAANWTAANPTLARGEIGIEYDTNKTKIGDGTTAWNSLAYSGLPASSFLQAANNLSDVANATASLNNLLPSQTGNAGEFLTTDGTNASWGAVSVGGQGGGVFGDGSDGAVTFDGVSTVLGIAPGSSTYGLNRDIYCTDITVNNGVTIYTQGWRIFATGTLTVQNGGLICNDLGQNGGNGTAGAAGTSGPSNGTQSWGNFTWAGNGGAGQRRTTAGATNGGTGIAGTAPNLAAAGGAGGSTTGGTAGTGGAGGAVTAPVAAQGFPRFTPDAIWGYRHRATTGVIFSWSGGSAGGGGSVSSSAASTSCASGGGGGAGGLVFVAARTISLGGFAGARIRSNGGNGGNGFISAASGNHGAGGGGGGAGGVIVLIYGSLTGSARIQANGGTGGTGASFGTGVGNNGSAGGAGSIYLIPA